MSRILLLTKNILNEQQFEIQLKLLGREVLTSMNLLNEFIKDKLHYKFLSMFPLVIVSETIDNAEMKILLAHLKKYPLFVIRKTNEHFNEVQSQEWKEQGISEWIDCQPTLEILREKLSYDHQIFSKKIVFREGKRDIASLNLSKTEKRLMDILYNQKHFTSREELCYQMWRKPKTNSTMSQLSTLVKKINQKLVEQKLEVPIGGPHIETSWGQGYKLHDFVYEQLYTAHVDEGVNSATTV